MHSWHADSIAEPSQLPSWNVKQGHVLNYRHGRGDPAFLLSALQNDMSNTVSHVIKTIC